MYIFRQVDIVQMQGQPFNVLFFLIQSNFKPLSLREHVLNCRISQRWWPGTSKRTQSGQQPEKKTNMSGHHCSFTRHQANTSLWVEGWGDYYTIRGHHLSGQTVSYLMNIHNNMLFCRSVSWWRWLFQLCSWVMIRILYAVQSTDHRYTVDEGAASFLS